MVSFSTSLFPLLRTAIVVTFFIAGLLFICASSTSITWERTASRRRPAFSSHLIAPTIGYNLDSTEESVSAMSKSVWRAVIEVGFIIFLFYSNLLMGEFESSGMGQKRGLSWAIGDVFTASNFED